MKTTQREAITVCLKDNTPHSSTEKIYEAVSEGKTNTSLASGYNTLSRMKREGNVRALAARQGGQKRYDPDR